MIELMQRLDAWSGRTSTPGASEEEIQEAEGALDRQFYLAAWAGEPVTVHRKNQEDGSVFVPHPFVSVVGGLPPDLLDRLRGDPGVSDGFLDRVLFSYPRPMPRSAKTGALLTRLSWRRGPKH
jgi:hypothetical protein